MLIDLLDEDLSDLDVMVAAVRALGAIGGEEAMERLIDLRTHPDEQLREAVHEAIEQAALQESEMAGDTVSDLEGGWGETDHPLSPNQDWC